MAFTEDNSEEFVLLGFDEWEDFVATIQGMEDNVTEEETASDSDYQLLVNGEIIAELRSKNNELIVSVMKPYIETLMDILD